MPREVAGEADLAAFRKVLTAGQILGMARRHGGRLLVQLAVGVGKSVLMDELTLAAARGGEHDLVVVLCPTRQLIRERRPVREPPEGLRVEVLRPRPAADCGPERDGHWRRHEAAGLGALGRERICGACPLRGGCFWPGQYGGQLRGSRIIYATQAHLERSPRFVESLAAWAGAGRPLALLDESDFAAKPLDLAIPRDALDRHVDAVAAVAAGRGRIGRRAARHLEAVDVLRHANTAALQEGAWRVPPLGPAAARVQEAGLDRHGDAYRFLGHRLGLLDRSLPETRQVADGGELRFAARPHLGEAIVFSGTTDPRFAAFRLGGDYASPFADCRFRHPGTRWYNIASPIGARRYFPRHAPQVLDLFARLAARRIAEGKRVLLIAKKCFAAGCAAAMGRLLAELGADARVVSGGWTAGALADPRVVPLITYGQIGTNLFEAFDCAYCLTGYYVDERVVDRCLQDLTREDLRLRIRIETAGCPRRRRARVADPGDRFHDIAGLAQAALEQKEHGVVVQAVGRVRPFTRPREVVTFQMAGLPGVAYDAEFATLAEARRHLGIPGRRAAATAARAEQVAALRAGGLTQAAVAARLGISVRTVRNHERRTGNEPS